MICVSIQHNVKILTSLVRCVIFELNPSILTVLLQLETLLSISPGLLPTRFLNTFCSLLVQAPRKFLQPIEANDSSSKNDIF